MKPLGLAERARLAKLWLATTVIPPDRLAACTQLLVLLADLMNQCADHWIIAAQENEPPCIVRAKEFIRQHARQPFRRRHVTDHVGLSPQHLCRLFKKTTGTTLTDYVHRVRVASAKQLLLDPAARVKEVAYATGFKTVSHFERVFRQQAGLTPRWFRRQSGNKMRQTGNRFR